MNLPRGSAFYPVRAIRSIDDIKQVESTPVSEAITARSTYEIFVNSAQAFGEKTALRFLKTADPHDETITWSFNKLLKNIRYC